MAQELGLWADSQGKGAAFHFAAFKAYFAEGKNIAYPDVLIGLADAVGLSASQAEAILSERQFRSAVDADWALAKEEKSPLCLPCRITTKNWWAPNPMKPWFDSQLPLGQRKNNREKPNCFKLVTGYHGAGSVRIILEIQRELTLIRLRQHVVRCAGRADKTRATKILV